MSFCFVHQNYSLVFTRFNFVSSKVLFSFNIPCVLTQHRVIFLQTQFVWSVHSVLLCVVVTVATFFTYKPYNLSFISLLCHDVLLGLRTDLSEWSLALLLRQIYQLYYIYDYLNRAQTKSNDPWLKISTYQCLIVKMI